VGKQFNTPSGIPASCAMAPVRLMSISIIAVCLCEVKLLIAVLFKKYQNMLIIAT
jgi:hypothetical protein